MASLSREARSNDPKARAEANFKKEERERDGAKAMLEYLASGREIREQMARLRALRLAKEAQEAQIRQSQPAEPQGATGKVRKVAGKSAGTTAAKTAARRKPAKV